MPVLSPASTRIRTSPSPAALWHLLSLDAPTVAALWTWFVARSNHVPLPLTSIASMAIAVWLLYAADRLLDARHLIIDPLFTGDLEQRHRFHHRHRSAFTLGILAASVALAVLIPHLAPAALRLDLILGALLAGYFLLIHVAGSAHRLPKEIAVGLFFSAAVFIPTVARAPQLRPTLAPAAALFALLCTLNCLFIYAWEHTPAPTTSRATRLNPTTATAHPATRLALQHLIPITVVCLLAAILLAALDHHLPWSLPTACAISTAILLAIHQSRHTLTPLTRRAAADLALLTPLLLFHP